MSITEPVITDVQFVSSSYVLVWSNSLPRLLEFDSDFLKHLFDKPELTHVENEGDSVHVQVLQVIEPPKELTESITIEISPAVLPRLLLNKQRFLNYDSKLDRLLSTHDKFRERLIQLDTKFVETLIPVQMGINLEFEVVLDDSFVAKQWFYEKIFGIKSELQNAIFTQEIKYTVVHSSGNVATNVSVQPRFNNIHSLFISTNTHYSISPILSFGDSNEFKVRFEECINLIKNSIIPFLLKGR